MKFFVVALITFNMGGQYDAASVMQIPFETEQTCKEYVAEQGHLLQNDVMIMYPNTEGFSLVCMNKIEAEKVIIELYQKNKEKTYI